uniref:NADH-ubiquinone oxidoreductase chain 5 n=1 Tax=Terebratalia transversa TaxID=34513 RepID=Q953X4_TERTR|nr:NADH dehydrogenase subunit 5 [Terebratalia transversa]AAK95502.1 NADH dehydrogenase subunit 5 [Terebratalia transversa]
MSINQIFSLYLGVVGGGLGLVGGVWGVQEIVLLEWEVFYLGGMFLSFPIILDSVSLVFSGVVLMISGVVFWYSEFYMAGELYPSRFYLLTLMFVGSMSFLIFVPNVVSLLIGWDGLGLISFCLVIYYQNKKSLASGVITVLMNRVGDACLIMVVVGVSCFGDWSLFYQKDLGIVLSVLIVVGGLTKSAQIPFSAWLPAAMSAPTPISALVHSSTLVTAGVYLIIRFYSSVFSSDFVGSGVLLVGFTTSVMASLSAVLESDLKKVVALSTLSQLGLMFCAMSFVGPVVCLFHLVMHSLFKSLLFLSMGNIIHMVGGSQDLRSVGGLYKQLPLTVSCMNVSFLAMSGVPFLAAFYSKDMIVHCAFEGVYGGMILFMFFFSLALTVPYCLRLSYYLVCGSLGSPSVLCYGDSDKDGLFPMIVLVLGSLVGGSVFSRVLVPNFSVVCNWGGFLAPVVSLFMGVYLAGVLLKFPGGVGGGGKSESFWGGLWFLGDLASKPVSVVVMSVSGTMLKSCDQGWVEHMTSKSFERVFYTASGLMLTSQVSSLKSSVLFLGGCVLGVLVFGQF